MKNLFRLLIHFPISTVNFFEASITSSLALFGISIRGAKKGPDIVDYGIHWLQRLEEIVIDDKRCPNTARASYGYELGRDARGELKADYPDKDNHIKIPK